MKKMLLVLCALALMLIPMSSMAAMTSISDSEMEAVTGQMGVSIALIAEVDVAVTNLSYGDTDVGTIHVVSAVKGPIGHGAGYVNVGVGTVKLRIGFRDTGVLIGSGPAPKPIMIDVLTAGVSDPIALALGVNGKTIVRIGLPDLAVVAEVGEITIALTDESTPSEILATEKLGVLEVGTLTLDTYSELTASVGLHQAETPCQLLIWAH